MCDRRISVDDEVQQRQFPAIVHSGDHETDQGKGRRCDHLRADAGKRHHILRFAGGQ